jgi:hypothetical protein
VTVTIGILEGVIATLVVAVMGAAIRHWLQTGVKALRDELVKELKPVKQLERNGGSHLADAVYDIRDRLDEHLEESAQDRRRLASLERRFSAHLRDGER